MREFILNQDEMAELFLQDPETRSDGGYQSFLVKLQDQTDHESGRITVNPADLERIPKYAFDYGNGGWENRLKAIFKRHLGPNLGR